MRFEPPKTQGTRWVWAMIALVVLVTLGLAWLSVRTVWGARSMSYEVAPAGVTIHFGPSRVEISRPEITGVRIESELSGRRRHVGTSFPGLYEGRWSFDQTGPITLFATSLKRLVVIETADRRFGVSPEAVEEFVAAIHSSASGNFLPVPSDAAWGLAALAAVPNFMLVVALFILSPYVRIAQRIAYELSDDALMIHGPTRPIVLPYTSITDVRLESPKGVPIKSGGASLPGFYWGSFLWKQAGRNVKLHATRLRPIVLVTSGRTTYGISPQEPDAFLAELLKRLPPRE